jgi:hypothetical protein
VVISISFVIVKSSFSSIANTLPLTELTGIRPGEEGKPPGSATEAELKKYKVKRREEAGPTALAPWLDTLYIHLGGVSQTEGRREF